MARNRSTDSAHGRDICRTHRPQAEARTSSASFVESKRSPNSAPSTSGVCAVRCATMVSARGPWPRPTGHGLCRKVLLRQPVLWRCPEGVQGEAGAKAGHPGAPLSALDPSIRIWPLQLRSSGLSDAVVYSNTAQYGTGCRGRYASPGRLRLRLRGSSGCSVAAQPVALAVLFPVSLSSFL